MQLRVAALAVLVALPPAAVSAQTPPPPPRTREITVSGAGEARAAPDLATATFTVLRNAKTAREALDGTNAAMRGVIDGMKGFGIEARDLQTSGFGITPQYRYDNGNDGQQKPPELVGYEARNSLTVRIRDLGKTGEILDKAIDLGVNSDGNVAFSVEDPAKLRTEARRSAVRDAAENAKVLAETAGVALGEVVRIEASEGAFPPPPMPMARMAMEMKAPAPAAPVEAGETAVQSSVTMVFAIRPN